MLLNCCLRIMAKSNYGCFILEKESLDQDFNKLKIKFAAKVH